MKQTEELFHQVSTWMHFIGGYYSDEKKFIAEAEKHGISRRVPAQVIRGMEFGDGLIFLRYADKKVYAFAEGVITGVILDGEISKEVGQELIDQGKATYDDGGGMVHRECGSYFIVGTYRTSATLKECMDMAQKVHSEKHPDEPMFVMVNASLTRAYEHPVYLSPAPKFNRGFMRSADTSFVFTEAHHPESKVVGISGYAKNKKPRKSRKDMPMLPEMVEV